MVSVDAKPHVSFNKFCFHFFFHQEVDGRSGGNNPADKITVSTGRQSVAGAPSHKADDQQGGKDKINKATEQLHNDGVENLPDGH